jgi:hypothetical protein
MQQRRSVLRAWAEETTVEHPRLSNAIAIYVFQNLVTLPAPMAQIEDRVSYQQKE